MRADQAKTIPIDRYLEHLGYKPANVRSGGRELFYHSPIREGDTTPSFKVDTTINKWYDHGLSRGGNTLDLAIELCRGSVRDALHALDRTNLYNQYGYTTSTNNFTNIGTLSESYQTADEKEKVRANAFRLLREGPIEHPALLQYLKKRKIDLAIAQKYLKEIRFEPSSGGKWFVALGWPNGTGYEARNSLFKGFVGTGKDTTYLKTPNSSEIAVFEGFMDFLSYLTEHKLQRLPYSAIILNSGNMKARALPHILEGRYRKVHLFMDNDEMGNECMNFFEEALRNFKVIDHRSEYSNFKDFNAFASNV